MRVFFLIFTSLTLQAQTKNVVVISHRGEHLRHPENTMPAFVEAVRVRADYIEVDVRTTSDGKLVLMHDGNAERTTGVKADIAKMTFDEVRGLDAGAKKDIAFTGTKVPTFDEVMDYARGKINIYVDVKAVSPQDLVEHIHAHGMTDNVVIYSGRISKDIQDLDPRLRIMPEARNPDFAQKLMDELHLKVMAFDAGDFKPETIAVAKKGGAQIYVDRLGPADNPEAWRQAVEAGADGIQTDHPEELVKFLKSR